jgi:hypothetical protein
MEGTSSVTLEVFLVMPTGISTPLPSALTTVPVAVPSG